jgi:hypothetical protein
VGEAMKKNSGKILDEFERLVLDRFNFLVESYGFHYSGADAHVPEFWICFRSSTVEIRVMFEIATGTWVELGRLEAGKKHPVEKYALNFVLMERAPQIKMEYHCPEFDDPRLPLLLDEQARCLRLYAEDVLRGDFQIFPRLRKLVEKRILEEYKGQGFN